MPNLTVAVTSTQATRLSAAFSFVNATLTNPNGSPATGPQIEAWMKQQLKARVLQYEQRVAYTTADTSVADALSQEGWGT